MSKLATTAAPGAAVSREQKRFDKLVTEIDEQKKVLQGWQEALPVYQTRYAGEYMPLLRRYNAGREKLVRLFDHAHDVEDLSRVERNKLRDLIVGIGSELMAGGQRPELAEVYDKYSEVSHADEQRLADESAKAMMDAMFGVDTGEAATRETPDEWVAEVQQKLAEKPKSAKASAKKARKEQAEQQTSQSIREVYRRLASGLHPDREPDPEERLRKTDLMQRVNMAYDRKDLLQLLTLQLELEHIDAAPKKKVADEKLRHHNLVLTGQLAGLKREIAAIEAGFVGGAAFTRGKVHPALVMQWLQRDIAGVKERVRDLKRDLEALADVRYLKAWLKHYRVQPPAAFGGPLDDD
jgi:hypothetical protein